MFASCSTIHAKSWVCFMDWAASLCRVKVCGLLFCPASLLVGRKWGSLFTPMLNWGNIAVSFLQRFRGRAHCLTSA